MCLSYPRVPYRLSGKESGGTQWEGGALSYPREGSLQHDELGMPESALGNSEAPQHGATRDSLFRFGEKVLWETIVPMYLP